MPNSQKPIAILLLLILATSCRSGKETSESGTIDLCSPSADEIPRIMLLNFEIFDNDSIVMINSAINQGRLRRRREVEPQPEAGDLVVAFLTNEMLECVRQVIPNPLNREVEFAGESGEMQSRIIPVEVALFPVRVQLHSGLKYVQIHKVEESGQRLLKTVVLQ